MDKVIKVIKVTKVINDMEAVKRIIVGLTKRQREQIGRLYDVSLRYVEYALSFDNRHVREHVAEKIRQKAMKMGGYMATRMEVPVDEVVHCEGDNHMRQWFANGMMLDIDKGTGLTKAVTRDKRIVKQWDNPMLADLPTIQDEVAAMSC